MYVSTNRISHYSGKWTETQVKHLLRRSLFGVTIKDIAFFKNKNLSECLELLLKDSPPLPAPTYRMKEDPTNAVPKGQSLLLAPYNKKRDEDWTIYLKAQWVEQMINPLQHSLFEKMVLFWHNHFVIQFTTVSDSRYHYQYLKTLRKHALGNFKSLLYEITINPGMLVYLNGNLNNKHNPNENYGRELQELFTIGKGTNSHYSETDVKAAAKVLSGWKDDKSKINSYFDSSVHNSNDKTFSAFYKKKVIKGKVGIDGAKETEELVEMICANPEVANFICRKIYRWFVHSHIDSTIENNVIQPLAEILRTSNYEIKPVLRALFSSDFFYNQNLIGAMFKSPVDYFIGVIRELDVEVCIRPLNNGIASNLGGLFLIGLMLEDMGQNLGNPPSVAGWPAYYEFPAFDRNWVNSENLSARGRVIKGLTYFEEEVFNTLPNPHLEFHFFAFVSKLNNPSNPKDLVFDTLKRLMCIMPSDKKIEYIQSLLGPTKSNPKGWTDLWSNYKKSTSEDGLKEIKNRLRVAFNEILLLPEYQIM